jgi:hypothetical protein
LDRPGLGLPGAYFRLSRAGWLHLRPVIWLAGTNFRLARAVWRHSGVGTRKTSLSGDGPGGRDYGRTAFVHVVELLAILGSFALVL